MGFTDVFFCPLLVNDIASILFLMLEKELQGLYHVLSPECVSKYKFGVAVAQRFKLDSSLISPTSVAESSLSAARSPNLILKIDKLINDLGVSPPNISTGIERFYTLYQQDYPQFIKNLAVYN